MTPTKRKAPAPFNSSFELFMANINKKINLPTGKSIPPIENKELGLTFTFKMQPPSRYTNLPDK